MKWHAGKSEPGAQEHNQAEISGRFRQVFTQTRPITRPRDLTESLVMC